MPIGTRVLVVARPSFANPIIEDLRREPTVVEHVSALDDAHAATFDVVLVEEGFGDWHSALAKGVSVIVYADRADCDTVAAALADGADDVVSRADRPHETVARIRALARRRPKPPPAGSAICVGNVRLDPERRRVTVDGAHVDLTRLQFELLEHFLRNAGVVQRREVLLERVWDMAASQESNAVEIQVRRLRGAIGDDPRDPKLLRTVRGIGYLYERLPPREAHHAEAT